MRKWVFDAEAAREFFAKMGLLDLWLLPVALLEMPGKFPGEKACAAQETAGA
jgi:hypothetical protein